MNFISIAVVGGVHVVTCQITLTRYPYTQGDLTSRKAAEALAETNQRNLLAIMRDTGIIPSSAKDLDTLQKAYTNYVSQDSNFLENAVDELGREGVRCLVTNRFYVNGEAVAEQNQLFASLRALGYLAPGVTSLEGVQAAYALQKRK